jgi:hypothetical protein
LCLLVLNVGVQVLIIVADGHLWLDGSHEGLKFCRLLKIGNASSKLGLRIECLRIRS